MKIIVFGGAGFIGHHLVNSLQSSHDVCVYDNFSVFGVTHEQHKHKIIQGRIKEWYNVTTVNGSILDTALVNHTFNKFQPDIVINLAAYPRVSMSEMYPLMSAEGMITGLINTLFHSCKKYIHISSSNVYGNFQDGAEESSPCAPINLYGSLKLTQEQIIRSHCRNNNSNFIIYRPICVFGNYDLGDRLVPKFVKASLKGFCTARSMHTTVYIFFYKMGCAAREGRASGLGGVRSRPCALRAWRNPFFGVV